jgi:hypothetical protein
VGSAGFVGSVLYVAPRLLCGAFHLVGDALIGKPIVTDRFSGTLLDLANNLVGLAFYLI